MAKPVLAALYALGYLSQEVVINPFSDLQSEGESGERQMMVRTSRAAARLVVVRYPQSPSPIHALRSAKNMEEYFTYPSFSSGDLLIESRSVFADQDAEALMREVRSQLELHSAFKA